MTGFLLVIFKTNAELDTNTRLPVSAFVHVLDSVLQLLDGVFCRRSNPVKARLELEYEAQRVHRRFGAPGVPSIQSLKYNMGA